MEITEQRVRDIFSRMLGSTRYDVSKVPYHIHNNVDSPFVPYGSILNAPGFFCVAATTTGTTAINVFGPGGAPYNLEVTGMYLVSRDTTAGNITAYNGGATIATIAKGTTAGAMVGATSLANTSYQRGRTFTVVSSSAGNSTVFFTFTP
jgi:hypothetical protein